MLENCTQSMDDGDVGYKVVQKTLFHCYSDNICAYCRLHDCALTFKQVRHKQCLLKQCYHLQKNEDHPVWRQRERTKELRKARKAALHPSEGEP